MTYNEIIEDAKKLALKIVFSKYCAIHPIPAGGIAVAVAMNEILKYKMLSVEEYKNYPNKSEVLVIDDLVDSGKTVERYPESDVAVLYKKVHCPITPKYYLKEIGSEWVTFPHEKDKDGVLDHLLRVFEFINVHLDQDEQGLALDILKKIKK